jgi:hypothetical protein
MEKLKCESCGAPIEECGRVVRCEYCGSMWERYKGPEIPEPVYTTPARVDCYGTMNFSSCAAITSFAGVNPLAR